MHFYFLNCLGQAIPQYDSRMGHQTHFLTAFLFSCFFLPSFGDVGEVVQTIILNLRSRWRPRSGSWRS